MNRNDYRRALIMLRGIAGGFSGHVRLERRTLMGTMQFTVTGPNDKANLTAVLVGVRRNIWFGTKLGRLNNDRRDSAGAMVKFDPRNMDNRTLEDYDLILIVRENGGAPELLLSGFVNGSMAVDWSAVTNMLSKMFCSGSETGASGSVQELPPMDGVAQPSEAEMELITSEALSALGSGCTCDVTDAGAYCVCIDPDAAEECAGQADESTKGSAYNEFDTAGFAAAEPVAPTGDSAISNIDADAVWPDSILALRPLFEQNAAFQPFECLGYVFVRASLGPSDSGNSCAIGLKDIDGSITKLCYAVPGTFALEPPPGMEGYAWRSSGNGNEGYWTTCIDLTTGEESEDEDI